MKSKSAEKVKLKTFDDLFGTGTEHLLAVRSRIFVGLEEGDSKTADKSGGKTGIAGHCKKALQERKAGCL